jgi:L-asparagine transporter-like permease
MSLETAAQSQVDKSKLDLPRVLGFRDVIGILIGSVIGAGIFIVPNVVAGQVPSPILMMAVWLVGGVLSFFGALAFSELGTAYPDAGGMYVYLRESYGSLIAFLFGWSLFLVIDSGAHCQPCGCLLGKLSPLFLQDVAAGDQDRRIAVHSGSRHH